MGKEKAYTDTVTTGQLMALVEEMLAAIEPIQLLDSALCTDDGGEES